jgi:ABC-2 type transport system ATP-binding protein
VAHALEVIDIKKDYILPLRRRKVRAVDGLSFSLEEGGVVGFLGANGAGKTTTLKIILRLIFATSGQVKIFGRSHEDGSFTHHVGFLTERPYFYDYLTGREFLKFCAQLFPGSGAEKRVDGLLQEVGLDGAADRQLRRYSKGMLQRIGIAQALINDPKLLILDEPMSGLDPDGRAEMGQIIRRAHQRGATIIFSTHLLPDVEQLCDRVVIIDKGKLVVESRVADLLSSHGTGYAVEFLKPNPRLQVVERQTFADEASLQKGIDEIRRGGGIIRSVHPQRPSLEEVFLSLKRRSA